MLTASRSRRLPAIHPRRRLAAIRRSAFLLLLSGLVGPLPAAAQGTAPAPAPKAAAPGSGAKAEVRAVEAQRFAAMVRADVAALGPMLADDLTYVHSTGKSQGKAELLADLSSGALRYEKLDPSGVKVRLYGDVAVVNGQVNLQAQAAGRPVQAVLLFTDVYVRRDGRWQLAAWQSTRSGEPLLAPNPAAPKADSPPDRR